MFTKHAGYKYSFPFLTASCGISVKERRVGPLYKHLLNIRHPTMAFIGKMFPYYYLVFHLSSSSFFKLKKAILFFIVPCPSDKIKKGKPKNMQYIIGRNTNTCMSISSF
jgi:hypothetical protein